MESAVVVEIKRIPSSFDCIDSSCGCRRRAESHAPVKPVNLKGWRPSRHPALARPRAAPAGTYHGCFPRPAERAAMSLHNVTPGAHAPAEFNVIIEIPMNADPI